MIQETHTTRETKANQLTEKSRIEQACKILSRKDYAFFPSAASEAMMAEASANPLEDWADFQESWNNLAQDKYMADGGNYRRRRYSILSALPSSTLMRLEQHQPHYQSLNYNNLNGGVARHYEPIEPSVMHGNTMSSFIKMGCEIFGRLQPYCAWHIEVHQFRIEATEGNSGKPTPEGIHRDGVNFVMMVMIKRTNLANGNTVVYDSEKLKLDDFTLQNPLDMALTNDERTFHGATPIIQLDITAPATRDVLVVTFRRKK